MLVLQTSSPISAPLSSILVRSMSSLQNVLGAAPVSPGGSSSCDVPDCRSPVQDPMQQPEQPGLELPSLCGAPKNKLTLHRRGNRRISYYSQRTELFAHCKHCGVSGMPHQWFAANNSRCSGQCLRPPANHYPQGYKPPC